MAGLLLSRKKDQEIVIGEAGVVLEGPIVIRIMETTSHAVKLRVTADKDVPVHRREVHDRIQQELANGRT